ncbi:MAG: hypothetical protein QM655_10070 [Nocardioidaceae bacterium]
MTIIELDARRRTSLGRVGRREHTRYIVEEQDDGTLILTPALVIPATLSPERIESIKAGVAEAMAGRTRPAEDVLAELGLTGPDDASPPHG